MERNKREIDPTTLKPKPYYIPEIKKTQELKPVEEGKKPQITLKFSDHWNRFWGFIKEVPSKVLKVVDKTYQFVENLSQLKTVGLYLIIALVLAIIFVVIIK